MAFVNQMMPQNYNSQIMYWNPTLIEQNSLQLQLQHVALRNRGIQQQQMNSGRRQKLRQIQNHKAKYNNFPNVEPASGMERLDSNKSGEKTPSSLLPLSLESLKLSRGKTNSPTRNSSKQSEKSETSKVETTMPSRYTIQTDLVENSAISRWALNWLLSR